jgi:hypothetical protein
MGLLTILRKLKQKEKELRILMLYGSLCYFPLFFDKLHLHRFVLVVGH